MSSQPSVAPTAKRNIAAIAELEQQVTMSMQMLRSICQELALDKLSSDQEMSELAENTAITALANEIEKARETDSPG